jgi:hypothetical protein
LAVLGQNPASKMFSKVEGKLWMDKSDFGWIKENQRSFCSGPHLVDENLR